MADGGFLRDHQSFIGKKEGPYGMPTQMGLVCVNRLSPKSVSDGVIGSRNLLFS
jgi:hypothetical protein